jgi:3-hydroxyisobutyrate dehydrogenase-like beta-hydroxyacid dehydrogenase
VSSDNELAFIGLGGMGAGMALRLCEAGFPLVVHNRTEAKTVPLAQAGARVATTAGEAAAASIVLLSLSDEAAVEQVVFGELGAGLRPGTLVVDTSTVSPAYSARATERLAEAGVGRLEACVIGNPPMAREGRLRVYTAGSPQDAERAGKVLDALAQERVHVGPAGSACALKLSFNLILGNQIAALAEAAQLAVAAGVERDLFFTAVSKGGFSSPALAFRAELMRARRYEPPMFRNALMEKDLRLAVADAAAHGLDLPVTAGVAERFGAATRAGAGDKDAAAILELRSPAAR